MISNMTNKLLICTEMVEDIKDYGIDQSFIFASAANYGLSFFQNMLANVVNINYIYNSIVLAETKTQNMTSIYYNVGKICNIILDIPPIDDYEDIPDFPGNNF